MSFFTSLMFYRPTDPPVVTAESLGDFVRAFARLKVSNDDDLFSLQVKFGKTIDQDEKPSGWTELIVDGERACVRECKEIDWDLDNPRCQSLRSIPRLLTKYEEPIYRAFLSLGSATKDIKDGLCRKASEKNNQELCLDSWSLEIGPIESASFGSDKLCFVGWLAVSVSGYGYLYPWSFSELVKRAEKHSGIQKMMELCRKTWPIKPSKPKQGILKCEKAWETCGRTGNTI